MADIWGDFESDVAANIQADGETVVWNADSVDNDVIVFWRDETVEDDDGMGPRFWCAETDVPPNADYGDTVTRNSVAYEVSRFLPDGHGVMAVLLKT